MSMRNYYPRVAIGIITYNRLDPLMATIRALRDNIVYPNLTWVLSDDGSPEGYIEEVTSEFHFDTVLQHARKGMGYNWNRMIEACASAAQFTLCCQDDWLLTEPLDLRLGIEFMQNNPTYGMLRYHKLTGHNGLVAVVKEWDTRESGITYHHSDNEYVPHMLPFLELLPTFGDSDTFSPYSGGVHLRTRHFTNFYGAYPEQKDFSHTEQVYMTRVNHALRHNLNIAPRVAMFPHYIESRWRDISVATYRGTNVEKETIFNGA